MRRQLSPGDVVSKKGKGLGRVIQVVSPFVSPYIIVRWWNGEVYPYPPEQLLRMRCKNQDRMPYEAPEYEIKW